MYVTIHQPEFFPWVAFFNKVLLTDRIVLFDNVQFKHHYFENRSKMMIGGSPAFVTAPVKHSGRFGQRIRDVELVDSNWPTKMWRAISQSYGRSPFWADHEAFLQDLLLQRRWTRLIDLNLHVIDYCCCYLGIPYHPVLGSEICDPELAGSDLVLDTCRRLGASAYLSGSHGHDYLDRSAFAAAGIDLRFQDFVPLPHHRFDGPDAFPLGILDTMFNLGRGTLDLIRGGRA